MVEQWTDAYAVRYWFGWLAAESGYFPVVLGFLVLVALWGALRRANWL